VLGVTYKPNVADQRESPARMVARKLRARGAVLGYHDPFVQNWMVDGLPVQFEPDLYSAVGAADLVILLQDHQSYDLDRIACEARLVLDTRGRINSPRVEAL
jgi:UDP-N-acetyl-D-mannosaminuronate dehydrogenase